MKKTLKIIGLIALLHSLTIGAMEQQMTSADQLLASCSCESAETVFQAAQHECISTLERFISLGINLDLLLRNNGDSLVHVAAQVGADKTLRFLKEKGAVLMTFNNKRETPLMHAISGNHKSTVKLLLGFIQEPEIPAEYVCALAQMMQS
jgi:hypothetical protein